MKRIAISTTVPVEIIYAAGLKPVDLNNTFVTSPEAKKWLEAAEKRGFPKSMCAWIKGLYSACQYEKPDYFLAVTEGDCTNSISLHQILEHEGVSVLTFGFPAKHEREALGQSMAHLARNLNTNLERAEALRQELLPIRELGKTLDKLTYETGQVSGFENHLWLVNFSDFGGNPNAFKTLLTDFIGLAKKRKPIQKKLRLGYIGVPPMFSDLYDYVEMHDAQIVYNEVQRQFAMPFASGAADLIDQYLDYTYPYALSYRLRDIQTEVKLRQLDGVIHYTQAFCHRALDDLILRDKLTVPVLTLEGDQATEMDGRTKLRLEAYLDMLKTKKSLGRVFEE